MVKGRHWLMLLMVCVSCLGLSAQQPRQDTIFVLNDVNSAVMFSKGDHKYVCIRQVIPADIPIKELKLEFISSKATVIDPKYIVSINQDVCIPLHVLDEKFYTLYIKKGKITEMQKRVVIK